MDRRAFFKSALDKGGKKVVKAIDSSINKQASHWIRPPYALDELSFLLACTRCSDCIEACPHDVIFALSTRTGVKTAGTPALDLLNTGCHLCEDWPCVSACEAKALLREAPELASDDTASEETTSVPVEIPLPKLAMVSINTETCLPYSGPECGACIDSCPVPNTLTLDLCKPVINQTSCTGCGLCRAACIIEPSAIEVKSLHSQAT